MEFVATLAGNGDDKIQLYAGTTASVFPVLAFPAGEKKGMAVIIRKRGGQSAGKSSVYPS